MLKRWALPAHELSSTSVSTPMKLTCTHSVRAHDKDVNAVAVSPNDGLIASGSQDKCVRLWDSGKNKSLSRGANSIPDRNSHSTSSFIIVFSDFFLPFFSLLFPLQPTLVQ